MEQNLSTSHPRESIKTNEGHGGVLSPDSHRSQQRCQTLNGHHLMTWGVFGVVRGGGMISYSGMRSDTRMAEKWGRGLEGTFKGQSESQNQMKGPAHSWVLPSPSWKNQRAPPNRNFQHKEIHYQGKVEWLNLNAAETAASVSAAVTFKEKKGKDCAWISLSFLTWLVDQCTQIRHFDSQILVVNLQECGSG